MATVHYKKVTVYTSFVVVAQEVQPILGFLTCDKLKIVKRVLSIEAEDSCYQELLEECMIVFHCLGCLRGVHKIKLKGDMASPQPESCYQLSAKHI